MRFLKEMKWDALMMGVLYILLGVVALVLPDTMEKTLAYLIGVVLILAGAVSMICYLIRDAHQNYYHNDFVYGLLGIALGCAVLYKVELVIGMISVLLGFLVLLSGFTKLQDVIDMKRLGYGNWVFMLILAIINVGVGVLLIFNPFKSMNLLFRVLGVSLLLSGAADMAITFYFANKITKFLKEAETLKEVQMEAQSADNTLVEESAQMSVNWDAGEGEEQ
ncbi:MAG: DUF308 domain-containing protein [Lachnospiraceae bacterium]|nr:DUF308 domain-containing protein [Lachnospiraceae bacterium]